MTSVLRTEQTITQSLWMRLTKPHPSVTDSGERRQARLIVSMTLLAAIMGAVATIAFPTFDPTADFNFLYVINIALTFGLYFVSRTRHWQLSAIALVATTILFTASSNLTNTDTNNYSLTYLLFGVILAALVLPVRQTVITVAVTVGIIAAAPHINPAITNVTGPMVIVSVTSALMLLFINHRNGLERDRQAELNSALQQARSANNELIESKTLLTSVINNLPQSVVWKDRQSRYLGMNEHFFRDSGMESLEQMIGKDDHSMPWKDRADQYIGDDQAVMNSDTPRLNYEEPLVRADGTEIWLRTSKVPMHDAAGAVSGVVILIENISDHKQVQEDLKRSQQMLQLVMDTIPQNICWKDRNSVYLGSNRNFARLLGFDTPEQLVGLRDFDIPGSAEKAADYKRDDQRVMEANQPELNFEEQLPRADGTTSWLSTSKLPLHDTQNNVTGVLVMFEDITQRKQQEQEVLESRNLLQLVLDTIPVGVFWKDRDSFVLGCNKLFAQDAGFEDVAALLGHEGKKRVAPIEEDKFRADELAIMETGIPRLGYEEVLTLPNRVSRIIQTNKLPLRNASGEIIGTLGSYVDITQRKQQEQEVLESRNLLQLVLDTIPVRVFWKDSNLTYLGCNQLFASDAKLPSPADIIGRTDYELFPGDAEQYRADDERILRTGEVKLNFEEPQTLGDGSQIWLRTSKIPLHNVAGEIVGVMGTYDDITEQRRQEDVRNELIQELQTANDLATESVRLKSEFMSTMSHELRTPLNAIRGFTGIMLEGMGGEIDDEARHMLGRIDSNSGRLLGLINDLLDIAKIEAGRMELVTEAMSPQALAERWRSLTSVLAEQKGLKFEVSVARDLPDTLYGDSERITQVVTNLLSNAIKFTHSGAVALSLKRQADQWILEVSDTGVGIPPHALNYIFDEFRQVDGSTKRAYGGSGLGLAIVRNICRMMGGNVKVSSELGKGSVFTVTLPLVAEQQIRETA